MDRPTLTPADEPRLLCLDGDLRLVHLHAPAARAAIFGIAFCAGSSDDPKGASGLAHFVEHTIFKGTLSRSSADIINCMESVGGELNAFTTKEETNIYAIYPAGYDAMATELIADLACNAIFPDKELRKERAVVIDEINSYRDTPSEAVYDDFEDMTFRGTVLGHNILGKASSVKRLHSADCRKFVADNYTRRRCTLFYSGPAGAETIADLARVHFASLPHGSDSDLYQAPTYVPKSKSVTIDGLHQSHIILGIPSGALCSGSSVRDDLFANYIGGPGMNSLLNVELRERRGLVYTVEASVARFRACGLTTIYFGCDPDDTERCIDLCDKTISAIARTKEHTLADRLEKAKRQYAGQLTIASENRENRILAAARATLFTGAPRTIRQTTAMLAEITTDDMRICAKSFANRSQLIFKP